MVDDRVTVVRDAPASPKIKTNKRNMRELWPVWRHLLDEPLMPCCDDKREQLKEAGHNSVQIKDKMAGLQGDCAIEFLSRGELRPQLGVP